MIRTVIVEDESWVRKGMIGAIQWEEHGMALVGEAENGEDALRLLSEQAVDLLLIDMRMPRMDGAELLRRLERQEADCEIVVLSGHSDFEYMKQAISSKVFTYLLKPVNAEELNDVLRRAVLRRQEQRRERESRLRRRRQEALLAALQGSDRTGQRTDFGAAESGLVPGAEPGPVPGAESAAAAATEADGASMADTYPWIGKPVSVMAVRVTEGTAGPGRTIGHPSAGTVEAAAPEFAVWSVLRGTDVLLLCCGNEPYSARALAKQKRWAAELLRDVQTRCRLRARVGVGGWRTDAAGIGPSCEEALRALQFERIRGEDVVFYDAVRREEAGGIVGIAEEKTVAYVLEHTAGAELTDMVSAFFAENSRAAYVYLPRLRTAAVDFALTLERGLRKCGLGWLLPMLREDDMLAALETLHSSQELKRWTMEKAAHVAEALARRRERPDLIQEIRDYIEHHYHEDIQLIRLARKFYVNHIYLSRLFKQTTGENFIDYLTRVRMHKAKALLGGGNLGLHQVAGLVGYPNPYYFSKTYRKFFASSGDRLSEKRLSGEPSPDTPSDERE